MIQQNDKPTRRAVNVEWRQDPQCLHCVLVKAIAEFSGGAGLSGAMVLGSLAAVVATVLGALNANIDESVVAVFDIILRDAVAKQRQNGGCIDPSK